MGVTGKHPRICLWECPLASPLQACAQCTGGGLLSQNLQWGPAEHTGLLCSASAGSAARTLSREEQHADVKGRPRRPFMHMRETPSRELCREVGVSVLLDGREM